MRSAELSILLATSLRQPQKPMPTKEADTKVVVEKVAEAVADMAVTGKVDMVMAKDADILSSDAGNRYMMKSRHIIPTRHKLPSHLNLQP